MYLITYALATAKKYYTPTTYEHAIRVSQYVRENPIIPINKASRCIALAIMHDLLEDTEWKPEFDSQYKYFEECLNLITKPKEMNYIDYIKRIHDHAADYPEVYWVKLADMKDHLMQTETLTEKLKEKYLKALPYLL